MFVENPVLKGFYPDPSICRVGEDFYMVNSTFSYVPGIPVFHSRDLKNWEQIGNVLERPSQLKLEGAGMSRGIYAPTIRFHAGVFYVITTNVSYGGNFYVTAEDPSGPWSEPVYLQVPDGMDPGIDPSLFFEGDKCYYVGQRQKRNAGFYGDCEVWLQELDLESGRLIGEDLSLYAGSMQNAVWVEGPHLYRIGDYYYLTCAEQGTGFEHSISVARSRALAGPYENYRCNPLLTHRHLGRQYPIQNIGHGDLVDTPEGKWYLVMLGTRPINGASPLGRETFLAEVEWEDDWPVVNPGEGRIRWQQKVDLKESEQPSKGRVVPAWQSHMEMKFEEPLDLRFLFFRWPREDTYRIISPDQVELLAGEGRPEYKDKILSYMGLRQQSREFSISVLAGIPMGEGEGGLLYLHDDDNYIKLVLRRETKDSDKLVLVAEKREKGSGQVLLRQEMREEELLAGESVESQGRSFISLKITGSGQQISLWAMDQVLAEGIPVDFLSSERSGGFVGCTYGIYAGGKEEEYISFKNLVVLYQ